MNPIAAPPPEIWNEAGARVESHLRAYRIADPDLLGRCREKIIGRAAARFSSEPGRPLADLAAEETEKYLREWIDGAIGPSDEVPVRRFARGRAAVYLANLPRLHPGSFLSPDELPREPLEKLRSIYLEAGPDLEFASMTPRPIDLGPIAGVADETWETFAKWPALRGVAICLLSVLLLGTAFFLVHF